MRKTATITSAAIAVVATLLSCRVDRPIAPHEHDGVAAANIIHNDVDLDGTPDMIVRGDVTANEWLVRDEDIAGTCSAIEGGVSPGPHRLLRMTVMTPNIGDADIYIGDPNATFKDGESDLYEFAQCHNHYHFKNYALYELLKRNADGSEQVWRAAKRGFCMLDTDPNPAWMGEAPRDQNFAVCGTTTAPGNQGISHGWADTYRWFLGGQYFILDDNGGKQDPVPPGEYIIRITVNPPYVVTGDCPLATEATLPDGQSVCHNFTESNYANNVAEVPITIPDHPGRSGYGPAKDARVNTKDPKYEASR
jgi:hypothetical protein